ncbi:MAG: Uma2 family endonuclease [Pirellulaceae bacterium]
MTTALETTQLWTAQRLYERFGPIPLYRVRTTPHPGTATEDDVVWLDDHEDRLCELVDGILVEKAMGAYESMLGVEIASLLRNWVKPRKLGTILGADGLLKLAPGLVRIPDVAYFAMEKFPTGRFPRAKILPLAPDLAVEVLSDSNTKKEMAEKLSDYFTAGARLVWYVDSKAQQVQVFTDPTHSQMVKVDQFLDGGEVLPGFALNLRELFAELPPE